MDGPLRMDKEHETIFIPYKCRLKSICHEKVLNDQGIKGLQMLINICQLYQKWKL